MAGDIGVLAEEVRTYIGENASVKRGERVDYFSIKDYFIGRGYDPKEINSAVDSLRVRGITREFFHQVDSKGTSVAHYDLADAPVPNKMSFFRFS